MQAGHDRAAEALLDRDAFGVHRHVRGARGGSGQQKDHHEHPSVGRQRNDDDGSRPRRDEEASRTLSAEPADQPPGEGHRRQGADRRHEQNQTELTGLQAQMIGDPGDACREAAADRSVYGENEGHSPTGAGQLGGDHIGDPMLENALTPTLTQRFSRSGEHEGGSSQAEPDDLQRQQLLLVYRQGQQHGARRIQRGDREPEC